MPSTIHYNKEVSQPLLDEISIRSGQNLLACYQCRRCAAGCPVGDESGVTPDRLIRMILLGQRDEALNNKLTWKCVACYTCGTRCPNNIQTARINEALKQMGKEAGLIPALHSVDAFHNAFLASVSRSGRLNEIDFMREYETKNILADIKSGRFKDAFVEIAGQAKLGLSMLMKKRLHFKKERVSGLQEIKHLYEKAKK
jgi:heterodisulfide reductase subunit C